MPLVFSRDGFCGIKCSLPKDYNDPYELFLGVDLKVSSDLLASYNDIVQEITQYPTTCFSNSPSVSPMWAHYANNHSGFVVEFDVDLIKGAFQDIEFKDVDYKDFPDNRIESHLYQATGTKKPRHAMFLRRAVLHEAYFSKQTDWSYEKECRLVADMDQCDNISGNIILQIPMNCVSAIMAGSGASHNDIDLSKEISKNNSLIWYSTIIGKSQTQPFFKNISNTSFVFNGSAIVEADTVCNSCSEPTLDAQNLCPWCRVTDAEKINAAQGNPLRMLDHYGMLENYVRGFDELGRSFRKPRS